MTRQWHLPVARLVPLVIAVLLPALVYQGSLPPAWAFLSMALLVWLLFWSIRDRIHAILLVFLLVLFGSAIVTRPWLKVRAERPDASGVDAAVSAWRTGQFNPDLPIVLHIILDEMMSTGAMTDDLPMGRETRDVVQTFGREHGFRTSDATYSRYFFSGVALPNLMNHEFLGRSERSGAVSAVQTQFSDNAYLEQMAKAGYRSLVFQTAVLNFCASEHVLACETFNSFDPGGKGTSGLDLRTRTIALWNVLFRAYEPSYLSMGGRSLVGRLTGLGTREVGVLGVADRYDVHRFLDWFDRFAAFVPRVPRGTHVLAHFMVPHSPYLLTDTCVVSGVFEPGYYLGSRYPAVEAREQARRSYYDRYLSQVRCVIQKLDELLRLLRDTEQFHDATIIIHGDHGSRISVGNILEDYSTRDFIDNYATYFAVKAPGIEPGIDCEFQSLPEAFRRVVPGYEELPPLDRTHLPVVVNTNAGEGLKVEAEMPVFGCAAGRQ